MSGVGYLLNALAVPTMVTVGGTALPTEGLVNVLDDLATSVVKRETVAETITRAAPDVIPLLFTAGGIAVPYAGFAIIGVTLMVKFSKPPTEEDQQRMWNQATGIH